MAVATAVRISLGYGCSDECDEFSGPLLEQLAGGRYGECSVLQIPASTNDWRDEHRTARKRADRCHRRGYIAGTVERHRYADDIHDVNTSLTHRQGRAMSPGYQTKPSPIPDRPACPMHTVHPYGVMRNGTLVGYLWIYRSGELALVSQILGHGRHLENDIMYLLFEAALRGETEHGGVMVYNRHDSGGDGLRYFKERLGFREQNVEWCA